MIYVASPYSDPDPAVREARFAAAERFVVDRLRFGARPFSPIVYTHRLAVTHALPTDAEYWSLFNREMMRASSWLYLLALDGWDASAGVARELKWRREFRLPIAVFAPQGEGFDLLSFEASHV